MRIMELGRKGISAPVEIEFSVNMLTPPGKPRDFCLLQMRPMVLRHEREELELGDVDQDDLICRSSLVMGNGLVDDIRDIVVVDINRYDRGKSLGVAREVGLFNMELQENKIPYLLIGVGRWGSADPWLGIPVKWDEISGASVILETGFKDMKVTPSQGTHFFQNLTAFEIGYFTINSDLKNDFIDWDWLTAQKPVKERSYTRHLRFDEPLVVKMNGHNNQGIIIKPNKHNNQE
jgi:hypothetical protein